MKLNKTKYSVRQIAVWLWLHHKECRVQASVNVVAGLMQVGVGLLGVEMLRRLTDIATGARSGSLMAAAAVFATVLVFEQFLGIVTSWVHASLGVRAQNNMQKKFFVRLLNGRWSGVERFHSGDVLNRLFGDVNDIVGLMTETLPSVVVVAVQFMASFVYLYSLDATPALILVVVSPLFVFLGRLYFRKMRRIVRKIKNSNSALQSVVQESIQHKMIVKVLEKSSFMIARLEKLQRLLCRQVETRAHFAIFSRVFVSLGFSGGYFVALVWGLFQLQNNVITAGVLMAFTQLIGRIQRPLLDMARLLPSMVNSLTASERLMELEELQSEPVGCPQRMTGRAGVRFKDVSYRYTQTGRLILRHFTHDFPPASFTAVLGETGVGKTTLIRLMLALVEQSEGEVGLYSESHDGHDEVRVPVSPSTRCNFSYVPQGNTLFSGTIRENLLLGNPAATKEDIRKALQMSMADFVYDLPDGLDTRCGEQGGGLSEGQAQRIAIARALIRPCKVLLLDEATSALDVETERELLCRIKDSFKDTTVIFVTHRLSAVDFASERLVLSV